MMAIGCVGLGAGVLMACTGSEPTAPAYRITTVDCAGHEGGFAAAVAVDDHLLATAAHAVASTQSVRVFSPAGDEVAASVAYLDTTTDVALLRVDTALAPFLPFGQADIGDPVTIGTFVADAYAPRPGTVVDVADVTIDGEGQRAALQLDATIATGDSGAGVFVGGELVGVIFARSEADNGMVWAVAASEVSAALRSVESGAVSAPIACPPQTP
ncbi:MAG: serine protease [Acidimicrobiales bacterium]